MFRRVELDTRGALFFHSMPGRLEPFESCCEGMREAAVGRVISLNAEEEIEQKSPDYLQAIREGRFPVARSSFPITNFGVPDDLEAFLALAEETARELENGVNVLVHCAGGVGRTGTFGACVLAKLGKDPDLIATAGGMPETDQQRALLASLKAGR
jgi:hypothetical protein